MSDKEKPDYSVGFDGCPWCDEIPEVSKHFKYDEFGLIHRCNKLLYTISIDWTYLDALKNRWNRPKK